VSREGAIRGKLEEPTAGSGIDDRNFAASGSLKQKLYAFLESRPAGAEAGELLDLVFSGRGSEPEFGDKFLARLLGGDPNFVYQPDDRRWSLKANESLALAIGEASYVVVDLETTGGRPGPGTIIEIGAYRMTGQRIAESFQSLVRPHRPIPRFVSGLTSITNEMVASAPSIEDVLPEFRNFLSDAVMVAHNAPFDFAFLDFEFRRVFGLGLTNRVLCTLALSRRMLPPLRRRRLDALAEHFGLSTAGRHRGLGDARMAAELLSIFIENAAKMGLSRLDRLLDYQHRSPSGRRIERHVPADVIAALPQGPGVYLMRNERGDLLYVGKARRLKNRVASYFNGGLGLKRKTIELVNHVWAIETRETVTTLEASLLEARLIRELKPPYNRMLKSGPRAHFIKIDTLDPTPRLAITTRLSTRRGLLQIGPFVGRRGIERSVRVLSRMLGLRVCSGKLHPALEFSPCIYGQMNQCLAPCNLSIDEDQYGGQMRRAIEFLSGRSAPLMTLLAADRDQSAAAMRFEEANRRNRDLDALRLLSIRERRLRQAVTENSLVIVTGDNGSRTAYVILAGRLALTTVLGGPQALDEVRSFVEANYERYRLKPISRDELEPMTIVSRWLRERDPDEGRLIFLSGPQLPLEAIAEAAAAGGLN
jgi:DNA polymerase-3 subunit epsilon